MLLQVGNRGDVAFAQRADGQRIQRERPSGQKNVDGGKLRQVEQRGGNAGGDCRLFVVGEHAAGNQVDRRDARRDFNAYKPRSLRRGRAHGGCAALQQRLKRGEGLVVQAGVGEQAADRRVGRAVGVRIGKPRVKAVQHLIVADRSGGGIGDGRGQRLADGIAGGDEKPVAAGQQQRHCDGQRKHARGGFTHALSLPWFSEAAAAPP